MTTLIIQPSAQPDYDLAEQVLGRSVPRDRNTAAPTLWTLGYPELELNEYLRSVAPNVEPDTAIEKARTLGRWAQFLRDRGTDLATAQKVDWLAFQSRHLKPQDPETGKLRKPTMSSTWRKYRGDIFAFHAWAEKHYRWPNPLPHKIDPTTGKTKHIGPRTVSSAPDVMPLTPQEFELLLEGAHRTTPKGRERVSTLREQALQAWMVATGQRTETSIRQTIFELPPASPVLPPIATPDEDVAEGEEGTYGTGEVRRLERIRTAAAITKNNRAVLHLGLAGWLDLVRDYAAGDRDLSLRPYNPPSRLIVVGEPNAVSVEFVHEKTGEREKRQWNTVTASERQRMVTEDETTGELVTVMLFVQQAGRPWAKGSARNAITANIAAAQVLACERGTTFPTGVHPHSLRHTYAVWVAMLRVLRDEEAGYAHLDLSRKAIVEMTARQMGHAKPTDKQGVTDLYLSFLEEFMLDTSLTAAMLKGFDR